MAGLEKKSLKNPPNKVNKIKVKLAPPVFKENIIFIGSEQHYTKAGFWNKMVFIASGFSMADRGLLRRADKNTVAFVDVGYTKAEKLPLETLKNAHGFDIVHLSSSDDVTTYINARPTMKDSKGNEGKVLIQDVAFFCHGYPGVISLNFEDSPDIEVTEGTVASMDATAFVPEGAIYSYACRTGNSIGSLMWDGSFQSDNDAHPENSLAQKMADHLKVRVYAFLTRSWYGNVLRNKADSKRISDALKESRKTHEGEIISIPPDHEAFPHDGLSEGGFFSGTDEEGTDEYVLWRKRGAIGMPVAHDTPKGLSRVLRLFKPRN